MKLRLPDLVRIYSEKDEYTGTGSMVSFPDGAADLQLTEDDLVVHITGGEEPLCYIRLRWTFSRAEAFAKPVRIFGDAWERGYGNLGWQGIVPERCMPWYCLASDGSDLDPDTHGRHTCAFGVKVRPSALCAWQLDGQGVTLWLDIRSGGAGVTLKGRTLECAHVLMRDYNDISAFAAAREFCKAMCPDPILPTFPVYGSNNWYYAYGKSSHEEIIRDAGLVANLSTNRGNPPFMVIDDGWSPNDCDGPWEHGKDTFPDMKGLAEAIVREGARPGIWVRYLADENGDCSLPAEWHFAHRPAYLDPSLPEVIEYVKETTRRLVGWGYRLIKHDFSTFDIFGDWGMNRPKTLTDDGWCFHDRTRTSAEIVLELYRAVREAAGPETLIIGCNTIGHLCAGLVELNRTGDDTSGREWDRTRKMGVNTLAFRMPQNGIFYMCDADCVGIMGTFPWEYNKKWLRLLAASGSPLFVSCKPDVPDDDMKRDLSEAFLRNSIQQDELIPLDWMETICPEFWSLNGEPFRVEWCVPEDTPGFFHKN